MLGLKNKDNLQITKNDGRLLLKIKQKKNSQKYPSYEKAKQVCKMNNINSSVAYEKHHKELGLPASPMRYYNKYWTDWYQFLDKPYEKFIRYENAQNICEKNNIYSVAQYRKRYKEFDGLPSNPQKHYDEWVSWTEFLNSSNGRFLSFEDAKKICEENEIDNRLEYEELRKKRRDLPSAPSKQYKDEWISWYDFLGKKNPGSASEEQHKKWMQGKTAQWWMEEGHKIYKDQGASSRPDRIFGKPFSYFTKVIE